MQNSDAAISCALIRLKDFEISEIPDDNEIDHVFSSEFENNMEKVFSSFDKKKTSSSAGKRIFSKVAVIMLTVCLGAVSLVMASPKARAAFQNTVMEFYETHIKFHFISEDPSSEDFNDIQKIYCDYIPKGFVLSETSKEYEAIRYKYKHNDGVAEYEIYVSSNDGLSILTDKDKENIENLTIGNKESYLISGINSNLPYSTLIITGGKITVTVYGQLTRDEVIEIGNSIKESN